MKLGKDVASQCVACNPQVLPRFFLPDSRPQTLPEGVHDLGIRRAEIRP